VSGTEPGGDVITYSGVAQPVQLLAVVADRRLSAAALSALLIKDPSYRIRRQAHGLPDVRAMLAAERPQVMVLDVSRPAFFALIDASAWGVRTLLLLDPDDEQAVFADAVSAGVRGYLSRRVSRDTLEAAIAGLYRSGFYLDPLLMESVLLAMQAHGTSSMATTGLSLREREILVWIASGLSTKQVARECAVTPKTVANHVNNIVQKLNLRHRGQLVLYAAQQGLTTI
jgi:two-component system, NarL family, invasion response regulator UvrY